MLRKIQNVRYGRDKFRCPGTNLPEGVYTLREADNPEPWRKLQVTIRDQAGQKFILLWGTEVDVVGEDLTWAR